MLILENVKVNLKIPVVRSQSVDHAVDGGLGFLELTIRKFQALDNHLYAHDAVCDGLVPKAYLLGARDAQDSLGVDTPYPVAVENLLHGGFSYLPGCEIFCTRLLLQYRDIKILRLTALTPDICRTSNSPL